MNEISSIPDINSFFDSVNNKKEVWIGLGHRDISSFLSQTINNNKIWGKIWFRLGWSSYDVATIHKLFKHYGAHNQIPLTSSPSYSSSPNLLELMSRDSSSDFLDSPQYGSYITATSVECCFSDYSGIFLEFCVPYINSIVVSFFQTEVINSIQFLRLCALCSPEYSNIDDSTCILLRLGGIFRRYDSFLKNYLDFTDISRMCRSVERIRPLRKKYLDPQCLFKTLRTPHTQIITFQNFVKRMPNSFLKDVLVLFEVDFLHPLITPSSLVTNEQTRSHLLYPCNTISMFIPLATDHTWMMNNPVGEDFPVTIFSGTKKTTEKESYHHSSSKMNTHYDDLCLLLPEDLSNFYTTPFSPDDYSPEKYSKKRSQLYDQGDMDGSGNSNGPTLKKFRIDQEHTKLQRDVTLTSLCCVPSASLSHNPRYGNSILLCQKKRDPLQSDATLHTTMKSLGKQERNFVFSVVMFHRKSFCYESFHLTPLIYQISSLGCEVSFLKLLDHICVESCSYDRFIRLFQICQEDTLGSEKSLGSVEKKQHKKIKPKIYCSQAMLLRKFFNLFPREKSKTSKDLISPLAQPRKDSSCEKHYMERVSCSLNLDALDLSNTSNDLLLTNQYFIFMETLESFCILLNDVAQWISAELCQRLLAKTLRYTVGMFTFLRCNVLTILWSTFLVKVTMNLTSPDEDIETVVLESMNLILRSLSVSKFRNSGSHHLCRKHLFNDTAIKNPKPNKNPVFGTSLTLNCKFRKLFQLLDITPLDVLRRLYKTQQRV